MLDDIDCKDAHITLRAMDLHEPSRKCPALLGVRQRRILRGGRVDKLLHRVDRDPVVALDFPATVRTVRQEASRARVEKKGGGRMRPKGKSPRGQQGVKA